jgi:hypothetical protein
MAFAAFFTKMAFNKVVFYSAFSLVFSQFNPLAISLVARFAQSNCSSFHS